MRNAVKTMLAPAVAVAALAFTYPVAAQGNNPDQGSSPSQGYNQDQGNNPDQPSPEQPSQANPGIARASVVSTTATVEKVDASKQTVTLKMSDGDTMDAKVSPDVDLTKLHQGDKVNATYYQEVAIAVHKAPANSTPKVTKTTVQRGGVMAQQTTATAQILSVDPANNKVTIRGPRGQAHMLTVQDPDVQSQLSKVKKGDNVQLTYTQAVALSLQPEHMQK